MKTQWRTLQARKYPIKHCWRMHDNSIFVRSSCGLSRFTSDLAQSIEGSRHCKNCERALRS